MRIALGIALLLLLAPAPAAAQSANLLSNPGFEAGAYHLAPTSSVPEGWNAWYQTRGPADPASWMPQPAYEVAAGRAHAGRQALHWYSDWAVHDAGVYQVAAVPANAWVRFHVFLFGWSSQGDQFGNSDGVQHHWVGIDPTGATDPFGPTVVWSDEDTQMDQWVPMELTVQARGDHVTVFVRSQPDFPVKHNDVYADDAQLEVVDAPPPAAAPTGTPPFDVGAGVRGNDGPDRAVDVTGAPAYGRLAGSADGNTVYFSFRYPGGVAPYWIGVQAWPDDAAVLGGVGFVVTGPRVGAVYALGGLRVGGAPNVAATLPSGEPGTYLIALHNATPGREVQYEVWVDAEGKAPQTSG